MGTVKKLQNENNMKNVKYQQITNTGRINTAITSMSTLLIML